MRLSKHVIISLLMLISCIRLSAQKVDKVIQTSAYKSYFSYQVKNPLYVTYLLKKGGGDCDRSAFRFTPCGEDSATDDDYSGTGYDKGHLANAEDFAYNCTLDKATFCYYNCLPQTVALNRGIWKKWETTLRALSQKKAIFIVCGGNYTNKLLKTGHTVIVPDECYKIVVDPPTGKILYCLWFPNDNSRTVEQLSLDELKKRLHYPLLPEKNLQLSSR